MRASRGEIDFQMKNAYRVRFSQSIPLRHKIPHKVKNRKMGGLPGHPGHCCLCVRRVQGVQAFHYFYVNLHIKSEHNFPA
jgi:hypothetical protein